MALKLGRNGKLYYNAGTYGSPTWTEVTLVRDVTTNLDSEVADADHRGAGVFGADVVVKLKAGVDFEILWDPANAVFSVLLAAYLAGSSVDFLVLDGAVGTTGSQGVRATCQIHKFTRAEALKDVIKAQVSIAPTYAANAAAWYTA
jgi:hypothetical protein